MSAWMWRSGDRAGGFTYLGIIRPQVTFEALGTTASAQREERTEKQPVTNTDFPGYYVNTDIYSQVMFPKLCFVEH